MKKQILYSGANYATIVRDYGYFVDKTPYISKLERVRNPVFLRPRRFGKSLFCSILRYYYDRNYADQFEALFGHTWVGQHPTEQQNQYLVLSLNFSTVITGPTIQDIEESFKRQCNHILATLCDEYASVLDGFPALIWRPLSLIISGFCSITFVADACHQSMSSLMNMTTLLINWSQGVRIYYTSN